MKDLFGKVLTLISITVMIISVLTGCGGSGQNGQTGDSNHIRKDNSKAEQLYKSNCVSCHGSDLKGRIGPNLQKVGASLSIDQIKGRITNGGGGMPAFNSMLDIDQIEALATWLAQNN